MVPHLCGLRAFFMSPPGFIHSSPECFSLIPETRPLSFKFTERLLPFSYSARQNLLVVYHLAQLETSRVKFCAEGLDGFPFAFEDHAVASRDLPVGLLRLYHCRCGVDVFAGDLGEDIDGVDAGRARLSLRGHGRRGRAASGKIETMDEDRDSGGLGAGGATGR